MTGKYPILLALFSLFLCSTCKKGEDDPKISLRTRKARLTGEWRMVSGTASRTTNGYNESYTFDGSNYKINVTTSGKPTVYVGKYSLNLDIIKDGTFNVKETYWIESLRCGGTWNFNTGVGDEKRKENVVFLVDNVSGGFTSDHLFNRFSTQAVYKIKELRNKKLVISSSGKTYINSKGGYETFSSEYIFEQ